MSKETKNMADRSPSEDGGSLEASPAKEDRIATLLGVFHLRSLRSVDRLYVGLTINDLPTFTTNIEFLNAKARVSVDTFAKSGLDFPQCPFDEINPLLFRVVVPNPIDYKDLSRRQRAKDVLRIGATDGSGQTTELLVTEVDLLDGLVAARTPWQAINHDRLGLEDSVNSLYTVFLRTGNANYALLFKPKLPETSNQDIFAAFAAATVRQLLEIDARQAPEDQHGYVEVAREYQKKASKGSSLLDKLTTVDEDEKREFLETLGRLRHALTTDADDRSFMKSKAAFEFVGRLKFDDLMDMVTDMQSEAHRFFRNS